MGSVLHGSARTTPRLRAELQASQESTRSLAARYGLNPKTVAKWRERTSVAATAWVRTIYPVIVPMPDLSAVLDYSVRFLLGITVFAFDIGTAPGSELDEDIVGRGVGADAVLEFRRRSYGRNLAAVDQGDAV